MINQEVASFVHFAHGESSSRLPDETFSFFFAYFVPSKTEHRKLKSQERFTADFVVGYIHVHALNFGKFTVRPRRTAMIISHSQRSINLEYVQAAETSKEKKKRQNLLARVLIAQS